LLEACNAAAAVGDAFHDISEAVVRAWELVAGLGVPVATEAHLDQLLAAAARGLRSKKLYSAVHARLVPLYSHTAHHPGHMAIAPAAGTTGYR
jgi:hypothetical protein